jgi:GT2 family glycosyltransferase
LDLSPFSPATTTWQPAEHRHRLFATNIVVPLGIAHRREWIDTLGGFNELVSPDEDWDFVRRLARAGPLSLRSSRGGM